MARKRRPLKRRARVRARTRTRDRARKRPPAQQSGLYLFVNISPADVVVLKAASISRLHLDHLRRPVLIEKNLEDKYDDPDAELVAAVVAQNGKVLESFGWASDGQTFFECDEPVQEVEQEQERQARFRIPVPASARYLQFYRTDLVLARGGRQGLKRTSLAVYDMKPGGGGRRPRLPVPSKAAVRPLVIAAEPPPHGPSPVEVVLGHDTAGAHGRVLGATALLQHGSPQDCYNIVVLSDGFSDDNLHVFDKYANFVVRMLRTTKPFDDLIRHFNVFKVTAVSTDSGITNCPNMGVPKNTFFETTGGWHGTAAPGFIGTRQKERVLSAAETAIPQQYIHSIVTIVNCRKFGGSTPPDLGLTFLTTPNPGSEVDETFLGIAAHELGHNIAQLCEEYNPCNRRTRSRIYPNETTQREVERGTVKWKHLATRGEIDRAGRFVAVHREGDPLTAAFDPVLVPSARELMLGAFWGCHSGDGTAPPAGGHSMSDRRGRNFFRGMADCRMRHMNVDFCRVCVDLLTKAVRGHVAHP